VNLVGRWVASQTSRPDLPWTFGVIDTPDVNAFAAPGGYVVVTRGLYELLLSDAELAAVLGHEIVTALSATTTTSSASRSWRRPARTSP